MLRAAGFKPTTKTKPSTIGRRRHRDRHRTRRRHEAAGGQRGDGARLERPRAGARARHGRPVARRRRSGARRRRTSRSARSPSRSPPAQTPETVLSQSPAAGSIAARRREGEPGGGAGAQGSRPSRAWWARTRPKPRPRSAAPGFAPEDGDRRDDRTGAGRDRAQTEPSRPARTRAKGATVTITIGVLGAPTHADDAHHDDAHDAHHDDAHHDHPRPGRAGRLSAAMRQPPRDRPRRRSRVAVLAGGRSSEHEVSLSSGAAVREGARWRAGTRSSWVEIERDGAWRRDGERLSVSPGRRPAGSRRRVPRAARPVRRGRHRAGDARDARRGLRRRRRGGLGGEHGQGALQGADVRRAGVPQVDYVGVREDRFARSRRGGARARSPRSACRCSSSPRTWAPRSGSSR